VGADPTVAYSAGLASIIPFNSCKAESGPRTMRDIRSQMCCVACQWGCWRMALRS